MIRSEHVSPSWPPNWSAPQAGHSNEVEHRLTVLEQAWLIQREVNSKVEKRLTNLERGMVLTLMAMHALAHEKLPQWAHYVADILRQFLH